MEKTIEVPYPFVRQPFDNIDDEGNGFSDESWAPGTKCVPLQQANGPWEEGEFIAQGMGHMILTVVHIAKIPGRYADRVFYVRRWRDPDGKEFGKNNLRVTTTAAFGRMCNGFRHSYRLENVQ
jgi:hypothetical protein